MGLRNVKITREAASADQKAEWLSEEPVQIAEKRREVKGKGEKERDTHLNTVPKNSKER